jgi:hypothetical protein
LHAAWAAAPTAPIGIPRVLKAALTHAVGRAY